MPSRPPRRPTGGGGGGRGVSRGQTGERRREEEREGANQIGGGRKRESYLEDVVALRQEGVWLLVHGVVEGEPYE